MHISLKGCFFVFPIALRFLSSSMVCDNSWSSNTEYACSVESAFLLLGQPTITCMLVALFQVSRRTYDRFVLLSWWTVLGRSNRTALFHWYVTLVKPQYYWLMWCSMLRRPARQEPAPRRCSRRLPIVANSVGLTSNYSRLSNSTGDINLTSILG